MISTGNSKKDNREIANSFFSPIEKPIELIDNQKLGYFSLGNTFNKNTENGSYTDRLNNFVQRFSHELSLDPHQKLELLNCKKRFSEQERSTLGIKLTKNFKVKTEERIAESDEHDVSEETF